MRNIQTNPFVFGKIVTGKNFINRKNERNEIAVEIENSMNIILYAPRRYGKTSLIMQVYDDLKKKHTLEARKVGNLHILEIFQFVQI